MDTFALKITLSQGLALVNMLPGPPGIQLSIFLGHARGSLIGGILAGVCLILPAFFIVLALSAAYVAFGALPTMRSASYGLGPVVVGIFAVSVYRPGKAAIKEHSQIAIGVAAAGVMFSTSVQSLRRFDPEVVEIHVAVGHDQSPMRPV